MILKYRKQILLYFFLIVYLALLSKLILFKDVTSPLELLAGGREVIRDISLIPFKSTIAYFNDPGASFGLAVWNVLGNILLFIPLGIYLRMFNASKKWKNYLITIIAISLAFEVLQFILGVGHTDIDDILFNTIGGMFGVFMFMMMARLLKSEERAKIVVIVLGVIFSAVLIIVLSTLKVRL